LLKSGGETREVQYWKQYCIYSIAIQSSKLGAEVKEEHPSKQLSISVIAEQLLKSGGEIKEVQSWKHCFIFSIAVQLLKSGADG
jgi:hypothetical protein